MPWTMFFLVFGCTPSPKPSKSLEGKAASDAKATPTNTIKKPPVAEPVLGGVVDAKPPVFASVVGSGGTFCAVSRQGGVWCAKEGLDSQTGPQGPRSISSKFHPIPIPEPVRSVAMIDRTVCALTTAGRIWCWGNMELGIGGNSYWLGNLALPTRLRFVPGSTGLLRANDRFCAVSEQNQLWCWWYAHGPRDSSSRPIPNAPMTVGPKFPPGRRLFTADGKICIIDAQEHVACADGINAVDQLASMDSLFSTPVGGSVSAHTVEGIDRVCAVKDAQVRCTRSRRPCALQAAPGGTVPACRDTVESKQECFGEYFRLLDRPRPASCRADLDAKRFATWGTTHQALCAIDSDGQLFCRGKKIVRQLMVERNMENSPYPDLNDQEDLIETPRKFTSFSEPIREFSCARHTCCALLASGKVHCQGRLGHLFTPDPGASVVLDGTYRAVQVSEASLCLITDQGKVRCHFFSGKTFTLPDVVAARLVRRPVSDSGDSESYLVIDDRQRGHVIEVEKTFAPLEESIFPVDLLSARIRSRPVQGNRKIEKIFSDGQFLGLSGKRVYFLESDGSLSLRSGSIDVVEVQEGPDHDTLFLDARGRVFQYREVESDGSRKPFWQELKKYGWGDAETVPLQLSPPVRQILGMTYKLVVVDREGRLDSTSGGLPGPHRMDPGFLQDWFVTRLQAAGPVKKLYGRKLYARDATLCGVMENGRAFCAGAIIDPFLPAGEGPRVVPLELATAVVGVEITDSMIVFRGADHQLYYLGTRPGLFFPEVREEYDFSTPQIVEPVRFGFSSRFTRALPGVASVFALSASGLCAAGPSNVVECRFWRESAWQDPVWAATGNRVKIQAAGVVERFTELGERRVCIARGGQKTCFGPAGVDADAQNLTGARVPWTAPWTPGPSNVISMDWTQAHGALFAISHGRHDPFNDEDVKLPPIGEILASAAGDMHLCVLTGDWKIRCYGLGKHGQLGDGSNLPDFITGRPVAAKAQFSQLCAAGDHTCALDLQGRLFCWGDNAFGQLGTGDRENRDTPAAIPLPEPALELQCAPGTVCVRGRSGAVLCSGVQLH